MRILKRVKSRRLFLIMATTLYSAAAGAAFKDEIPTVAQLRSEVQGNPRVTPPSLLKFASFVRERAQTNGLRYRKPCLDNPINLELV